MPITTGLPVNTMSPWQNLVQALSNMQIHAYDTAVHAMDSVNIIVLVVLGD